MADLFDFVAAPLALRKSSQDMADDGMIRAIDHADAVEAGWSEQAYSLLQDYALDHFEFMTEEVRTWAHGEGLPFPPDGRAWGAVTLRAAKAGLIRVDRYQKTRIPPAHATPRPVWRSLICSKAAA